MTRFVASQFSPADPSSLAFFRIGFGALLFLESCRYFVHGKIDRYFLEPEFLFTYLGFEWVRPWPGIGLYAHFAILAAAAALVAVGLFYRAAAVAFFLGFSYVFLLEKALYLNHFYLIILISLLLVFVPAHRAFSLHAWRVGETRSVPLWSISLLRAQLGLVYFFAGIAKLNADWLRAEPLATWLAARASMPLLGPVVAHEWTAWAFSYGGLLLDLGAWPLLSARRTRAATFSMIVAFHLLNSILFRIGVFPWLMIAATTIFFEPDWPRRWFGLGRPAPRPSPEPSAARRRVVAAAIAVYLAIQVLVPLRHFLYPGSVHWTEEGHQFSWHMKLRGKRSEVSFRVTDARSGETWIVDPRERLTPWQFRSLGGRPDLILQFAHHVASEWRARGHERVEVRVTASTSLNGRPSRRLIDPDVDLAAERRGLGAARWILR